ncbi:MAG: NfeD family protein [Vicinamibacteraceae bacterium]
MKTAHRGAGAVRALEAIATLPPWAAAARLDEMALYSLSEALLKYLILQIPGWVLAVVVGWLFVKWFDVPPWAAIALVSLWIAKDFALFPSMRHFYESTSGRPRIVGDAGVAVTDLNPHGFVRIHGELWQAEVGANKHIAKGCGVYVRDIRGLLLIVDPALLTTVCSMRDNDI